MENVGITQNQTLYTKDEVKQYIQFYKSNPRAFTNQQTQTLKSHIKHYNLPFAESEFDNSFNIMRAVRAAGEGYLSGFTTINVGEQPKNAGESIARSIGQLGGFVGFMPHKAVGMAGKALSSFRIQNAAAHMKALAGKSVPMYIAGKATGGARTAAKHLLAKGVAGKAGAVQSASKFLTGELTSDLLEGAFRLGTSSAVASWQGGIKEMLSSFGHGAVTGAVFRGIGNVGIGDPTSDKAIRMIASSMYVGLPATMRGATTEEQVYEYLLGAYFGSSSKPSHVTKGRNLVQESYKLRLGSPKEHKNFKNLSPNAQKAAMDFHYEVTGRKSQRNAIIAILAKNNNIDILEATKYYEEIEAINLLKRTGNINDPLTSEAINVKSRKTNPQAFPLHNDYHFPNIENLEKLTQSNLDYVMKNTTRWNTGKDFSAVELKERSSRDAIKLQEQFESTVSNKKNKTNNISYSKNMSDFLVKNGYITEGFLPNSENGRHWTQKGITAEKGQYTQHYSPYFNEATGEFTMEPLVKGKAMSPGGNEKNAIRPRYLIEDLYSEIVKERKGAGLNSLEPDNIIRNVDHIFTKPKKGIAKESKIYDASASQIASINRAQRKDGFYYVGGRGDAHTMYFMPYHPDVGNNTSIISKQYTDFINYALKEGYASKKHIAQDYKLFVKNQIGEGRFTLMNDATKAQVQTEYRKQALSNMLYNANMEGHKNIYKTKTLGEKGVTTVDWLKNGHWIKDAINYNKRQSIWMSAGYEGDMSLVPPEHRRDENGDAYMNILYTNDIDSVVDQSKLHKGSRASEYVHSTDGAITLLPEEVEVLNLISGKEHVGETKANIVVRNANLGTMLGKFLGFSVPSKKADWMRENNIDGIIYNSSSKQRGARRVYDLNFRNVDGRERYFVTDPNVDTKMQLMRGDIQTERVKLKDFKNIMTESMALSKDGNKTPFFKQPFTAISPYLMNGTTPEEIAKNSAIIQEQYGDLVHNSVYGDTTINKRFETYLVKPTQGDNLKFLLKNIDKIGIPQIEKALRMRGAEKFTTQLLEKLIDRSSNYMRELVQSGDISPENYSEFMAQEEVMKNPAKRQLRHDKGSMAMYTHPHTQSYIDQVLKSYEYGRVTNPRAGNTYKQRMMYYDEELRVRDNKLGETYQLDNKNQRIKKNSMLHKMYGDIGSDELVFFNNGLENRPVDFLGKPQPLGKVWRNFVSLSEGNASKEKLAPYRALFRTLNIRVPMSSTSGAQVLRFGGFTGVNGNGILLHPRVMELLDGADLDGDTATTYFGGRELHGSGLKSNWLDIYKANADEFYALNKETKKTQLISAKQSKDIFDKEGRTYQQLYTHSDPEYLDFMHGRYSTWGPGARFQAAKAAAQGREVLSTAVTSKARLLAAYSSLRGAGKEFLDIKLGGKIHRYKLKKDMKNMKHFYETSRAQIALSSDPMNEAGLASADEFQAGLFKTLFEYVSSSKNGFKQSIKKTISSIKIDKINPYAPVDITQSKKKSPYFNKDVTKFLQANKLIAFGGENTSSRAYSKTLNKNQLNTGKYDNDDIVGVTINGGNKSKIDFKKVMTELNKAMNASATIITDKVKDRNRDYNSGERLVANHLKNTGYVEVSDGVWQLHSSGKQIVSGQYKEPAPYSIKILRGDSIVQDVGMINKLIWGRNSSGRKYSSRDIQSLLRYTMGKYQDLPANNFMMMAANDLKDFRLGVDILDKVDFKKFPDVIKKFNAKVGKSGDYKALKSHMTSNGITVGSLKVPFGKRFQEIAESRIWETIPHEKHLRATNINDPFAHKIFEWAEKSKGVTYKEYLNGLGSGDKTYKRWVRSPEKRNIVINEVIRQGNDWTSKALWDMASIDLLKNKMLGLRNAKVKFKNEDKDVIDTIMKFSDNLKGDSWLNSKYNKGDKKLLTRYEIDNKIEAFASDPNGEHPTKQTDALKDFLHAALVGSQQSPATLEKTGKLLHGKGYKTKMSRQASTSTSIPDKLLGEFFKKYTDYYKTTSLTRFPDIKETPEMKVVNDFVESGKRRESIAKTNKLEIIQTKNLRQTDKDYLKNDAWRILEGSIPKTLNKKWKPILSELDKHLKKYASSESPWAEMILDGKKTQHNHLNDFFRAIIHKDLNQMDMLDFKGVNHWFRDLDMKVSWIRKGKFQDISKGIPLSPWHYILFPRAVGEDLSRAGLELKPTISQYKSKHGVVIGNVMKPTNVMETLQETVDKTKVSKRRQITLWREEFQKDYNPYTVDNPEFDSIWEIMAIQRESSTKALNSILKDVPTIDRKQIENTYRMRRKEVEKSHNWNVVKDKKVFKVNRGGGNIDLLTGKEVVKEMNTVFNKHIKKMHTWLNGNEKVFNKFLSYDKNGKISYHEDDATPVINFNRKSKNSFFVYVADHLHNNKSIPLEEIGMDGLSLIARSLTLQELQHKANRVAKEAATETNYKRRNVLIHQRDALLSHRKELLNRGFRETGKFPTDIFYPHVNGDVKLTSEYIKTKINEISVDVNLNPKQKKQQQRRLIATYARARGGYANIAQEELLMNDSIVREIVGTISKSKDLKEQREMWLGTQRKNPSQLKREFHTPGWSLKNEDFISHYAEGIIGSYYDNITQIMSKLHVQEFEKFGMKGWDTGIKNGWSNYLRAFTQSAIGNPIVIPDEVAKDPKMKMNGVYSQWRDNYVAHTIDNVLHKLGLKKHKLPKEYQSLEKITARQVVGWSNAEARYQLATLLAHPKSSLNNIFGGTLHTIESTGVKHLANAKNFKHIQATIDTKFKTWDDVNVWLRTLGIQEEFMIEELQINPKFKSAKWKNAMKDVSDAMTSGKAKEIPKILTRHKIPQTAFRSAAWFMQKPETMLRRDAFLAHYLQAYENLGGIVDNPKTNPYLIEMAKKGVRATQFLYCVDTDTEILTKDGWKKNTEIRVNDNIYSVDKDGILVDDKIKEINIFNDHYGIPVTEFSHSDGFKMVVTDEHRNVIQNYNSRDKKYQDIIIRKTKDLKGCNLLLRTPLGTTREVSKKYSNDFVKLLAWVLSEGHYAKFRNCKKRGNVRITQSHKHNPEYIVEIRTILENLGEFREFKNDNTVWTLRKELAKKVMEAMPNKILTYDLVNQLTNEQMLMFIDTFAKGDGHKRSSGWTISQKYKDILDIMQYMLIINGIKSSIIVDKKKIYHLNILKSKRTLVKNLSRGHKLIRTVWCPTTGTGTWIARKNGRVFLTGNSAPFRPMFANTGLGKVMTRFQLWAWNSVRFRNDTLREARMAGYRVGTPEFERFKRLAMLDMFTIAMANAFTYSLFETALPQPYAWAQDIADFLFGDTKERERAFYGAYPGYMAPLQMATPPIARMVGPTINALYKNDWSKLSNYHIWTMFPFGRIGRDVVGIYKNPGMTVEKLTGLPYKKLPRYKTEVAKIKPLRHHSMAIGYNKTLPTTQHLEKRFDALDEKEKERLKEEGRINDENKKL